MFPLHYFPFWWKKNILPFNTNLPNNLIISLKMGILEKARRSQYPWKKVNFLLSYFNFPWRTNSQGKKLLSIQHIAKKKIYTFSCQTIFAEKFDVFSVRPFASSHENAKRIIYDIMILKEDSVKTSCYVCFFFILSWHFRTNHSVSQPYFPAINHRFGSSSRKSLFFIFFSIFSIG